jgi:hypothetical protein
MLIDKLTVLEAGSPENTVLMEAVFLRTFIDVGVLA